MEHGLSIIELINCLLSIKTAITLLITQSALQRNPFSLKTSTIVKYIFISNEFYITLADNFQYFRVSSLILRTQTI